MLAIDTHRYAEPADILDRGQPPDRLTTMRLY